MLKMVRVSEVLFYIQRDTVNFQRHFTTLFYQKWFLFDIFNVCSVVKSLTASLEAVLWQILSYTNEGL